MQDSPGSKPTQREWLLLAAATALFMLALFGPDITQPLHQHAFADSRTWASIANAMDVLSNLAFAVWGIAGLAGVYGACQRVQLNTERALAALFFTGLACTAVASAWYHLQPDDAGLGIDRLGMVIAFAGLLGLAVAGHISNRAGAAVAGAVVMLGPLSIWFWLSTGNVLPWLVIQFGGMALILMMACTAPRKGALAVRWSLVIAVYAVAKLLEWGDHEIYALTGELVSGHSLKHLVASLAAWPVLHALHAQPAFIQSKNSGRIQLASVDTNAT